MSALQALSNDYEMLGCHMLGKSEDGSCKARTLQLELWRFQAPNYVRRQEPFTECL